MNTTSNTNAPADEFVTLSARVYKKHAHLVQLAAKRAGKTVAAYMRPIVVEWAAADLGIENPDLSEYEHADLVGEVAKRLGLTPREFTRRAAREMAARELGIGSAGETAREKTREPRVVRRASGVVRKTGTEG